MKHDQESIQRMIHDTVSLLCRNSLSHGVGVRIQGLIGITVDQNEVFLVQFDDSYSNERQNTDNTSPTDAATSDPLESNPRKRPRLSETAISRNALAEQPAAEDDCDVIFVADDVTDNDVKLGFGQFCSSVESNCSYDGTGNMQTFKAEYSFDPTDLDIGENQSSHVKRTSRGNVLLRNMLADQNSCVTVPALGWEQAPCGESAAQTTDFLKREQTTRPRVKQVLILFTGELIMVQHLIVGINLNGLLTTCKAAWYIILVVSVCMSVRRSLSKALT